MIGLFWKKGQLDSWLFFVRSVGDLNRDPGSEFSALRGRKKTQGKHKFQIPRPEALLIQFKIVVDKMYLNDYYDGSLT